MKSGENRVVNDTIYFSLIVPTYNEAENIQDFLQILCQILDREKISYEIIISDDNSPDETWRLVQDFSKKNSRVFVLRRFFNKGLTPAVLDGIERASGIIVGIMDADLQHDPELLPKMIEKCSTYDLVIGSRYLNGNNLSALSPIRLKLSKFGTYLAKIFLGIEVSDPLSGYFVIRKELLVGISSEISTTGFKVLLEILGRIKNLKILEIEYIFRNRTKGTTKLSGEVAVDFLATLMSLRFRRRVSPRFLRYITIGTLGIFVNILGQWIANRFLDVGEETFKQGNYYVPGIGVMIGFLLSVLNNFILNNIWTFREKRIRGLLPNLRGFIVYLSITVIGFLIQFSVWRLMVGLAVELEFSLNTFGYIANLFGILTATTWNYFLSKYFMWKIE